MDVFYYNIIHVKQQGALQLVFLSFYKPNMILVISYRRSIPQRRGAISYDSSDQTALYIRMLGKYSFYSVKHTHAEPRHPGYPNTQGPLQSHDPRGQCRLIDVDGFGIDNVQPVVIYRPLDGSTCTRGRMMKFLLCGPQFVWELGVRAQVTWSDVV